jgi:hypothetical protein
MLAPNTTISKTNALRHGVARMALVTGNPHLRAAFFDGGDGGEGDKKADPTNDPVVQALIAKAVEDATKGLKGSKEEILTEKKQLKSEYDRIMGLVGGDDGLKRLEDLRKKAEQDEESKLIADGKVDLVIERRTNGMREKHGQQIQQLEKRVKDVEAERDQAVQKLIGYKTNQQLLVGADEAGVKPEYRAALISLVRDRVKLADEGGSDVFEVYGEDGIKAYSPNNSAKPMSVTELFDSLRDKMKDAFHPSSGGGAGGGSKAAVDGAKNPWIKGQHFNLSEQARIIKQDPAAANRLKAEAGIRG